MAETAFSYRLSAISYRQSGVVSRRKFLTTHDSRLAVVPTFPAPGAAGERLVAHFASGEGSGGQWGCHWEALACQISPVLMAG